MADVKTEILLYHSIRGAVRERERERERNWFIEYDSLAAGLARTYKNKNIQ